MFEVRSSVAYAFEIPKAMNINKAGNITYIRVTDINSNLLTHSVQINHIHEK